uniref:Uncharacterized protein n=1 Tax=viral metagenome TaxID=1070528 RepID=A0A6C0C6L1_9ZZZZ
MILALLSFIFLTVIYFVIKFIFIDRKVPVVSMGGYSNALTLVYIVLVMISQLFINVKKSAEHCNGTPQIVSSFIYTIIPNFFILGLVMVIMKVLPGWKSPFSNTIGYAVVYMFGVGGAFSDLLKTKETGGVNLGELMQKICDNKSIVINEITPVNFELFLEKMNKDKLLKPGFKNKPGYKKLWQYVVVKDSIAEFMWICLSGVLVISTTSNALLEIACNISPARRKAATSEFEAHMAKTKTEKPKAKLFTVHD